MSSLNPPEPNNPDPGHSAGQSNTSGPNSSGPNSSGPNPASGPNTNSNPDSTTGTAPTVPVDPNQPAAQPLLDNSTAGAFQDPQACANALCAHLRTSLPGLSTDQITFTDLAAAAMWAYGPTPEKLGLKVSPLAKDHPSQAIREMVGSDPSKGEQHVIGPFSNAAMFIKIASISLSQKEFLGANHRMAGLFLADIERLAVYNASVKAVATAFRTETATTFQLGAKMIAATFNKSAEHPEKLVCLKNLSAQAGLTQLAFETSKADESGVRLLRKYDGSRTSLIKLNDTTGPIIIYDLCLRSIQAVKNFAAMTSRPVIIYEENPFLLEVVRNLEFKGRPKDQPVRIAGNARELHAITDYDPATLMIAASPMKKSDGKRREQLAETAHLALADKGILLGWFEASGSASDIKSTTDQSMINLVTDLDSNNFKILRNVQFVELNDMLRRTFTENLICRNSRRTNEYPVLVLTE